METVFYVEGEPQGKDRPRFSRLSGRIYTTRKTEKYEQQIRIAYLDAGGKLVPDDCYVSVSVDAYFKIPKSFPKGKRCFAKTIFCDRRRCRTWTIYSRLSWMDSTNSLTQTTNKS